jgi:hypothetical protein
MHPDECFEKHRPDVKEVRGALDEQAHRDHIEKHHRELQDAAKQKEKEERASD